ncbi:hypothetical protein F5882DRAFT_312770, partial [Hyaloscypha sp. PMI_1271]
IELGTLCIYTDGSGINSHVNTAIIALVLQLSGIRTKRIEYISTSTTSIIYVTELKRLVLAFQIALDIYIIIISPGKYIIFTDNQAAI